MGVQGDYDFGVETDAPNTYTHVSKDINVEKIIDSTEGRIDEFKRLDLPFMAVIQSTDGHPCGGSIIGMRKVLTALHCVMDADRNDIFQAGDITVYIQEESYTVTNVIAYNNHNFQYTYDGDLCILELESQLDFSREDIQPILLAREGIVDYGVYAQDKYVTSDTMYLQGDHNTLEPIDVKFSNTQNCYDTTNTALNKFAIVKGMICTKAKSKSGHRYRHLSGSPLYIYQDEKYIQLAMASFIPAHPDDGVSSFDVHVNLINPEFRDWLATGGTVTPIVSNREYRNIALMAGAVATQIPPAIYSEDGWYIASKAIDNSFSTYSHTMEYTQQWQSRKGIYFKVRFPRDMYIHHVIVYPRRDCCFERLHGFKVMVGEVTIGTIEVENGGRHNRKEDGYKFSAGGWGDQVIVMKTGGSFLHLAEVQVLGREAV